MELIKDIDVMPTDPTECLPAALLQVMPQVYSKILYIPTECCRINQAQKSRPLYASSKWPTPLYCGRYC